MSVVLRKFFANELGFSHGAANQTVDKSIYVILDLLI